MTTEACCTPAPPAADTSQGREDTLGGLRVYLSGSASATAAVILIPDIFGFNPPLMRKLADKVGAAGYLAVVPDLFYGDDYKPVGEDLMAAFPQWLPKHLPASKVEATKGLVKVLKDRGIKSIGIGGFCWGAKVAAFVGKEQCVNAVVQCHPSLIEASDYEEMSVPVAVLAAPTDGIDKYEDLLASRAELKSFVKIFPGVNHGWTVRYDENDEHAVEKANEAHKLMIDWFAKYL
jgi:dienelactone hydrolase